MKAIEMRLFSPVVSANKNIEAQREIDNAQVETKASCLNEFIDGASQKGGAMITTIILSLAVLTAALVIGVFVVALMELNEIDEIIDGPRAAKGRARLKPVPGAAPGTADL